MFILFIAHFNISHYYRWMTSHTITFIQMHFDNDKLIHHRAWIYRIRIHANFSVSFLCFTCECERNHFNLLRVFTICCKFVHTCKYIKASRYRLMMFFQYFADILQICIIYAKRNKVSKKNTVKLHWTRLNFHYKPKSSRKYAILQTCIR